MVADPSNPPPTLLDLLLRSSFGRADPERARALLDRVADPLFEARNEPRERKHVE